MAVNINEAQSIVKKLSSEQLIESYKNGSLPQFIVFSEMKSRQDMMKTQPQMPTQTVAESMAGSRDEEPVMAARGGQVYSKMPREIDYYSSLTDAQKKMIASRELPDELSALIAQQTRPDRDYNLARAESYLKDARASTETFQHGGEVEEPRFPMSGEEFANIHIGGIIGAESGGVHIDPKTGKLLESPAGAKGITQIMDKTARDPGYGIKPKRDDSREASIDFSKDFLKTAYNLLKDPDQAVTAHNTGIFAVQEAVNKAKKYGGHWKEYLSNDEGKNYYGKVIGKAQSALPPRQDMAGADTYEPAPVYDNAFLPSGSTANNVGTEKDPDNRGLGAYLIKQALEMRGVPQRKKEGGPIRLQAGSGASVLRDRQREYLNPYIGRPSYESQIPPLPEEPVFDPQGDIISANNLDEYNRSVADASAGEPVPSELWDVNQTTADLERQANERLAEKAQGINFDADPTGINWNSPEVQRVLGYKYPKPPRPYNPSSKARPRIIGDPLAAALNEQPKEKQAPPVTGIEKIYPPEVAQVDFPPPEAGVPTGPAGTSTVPNGVPTGPAGTSTVPNGMTTGPAGTSTVPNGMPTGPAGTPTKAGPRVGPSTGASSLSGQLAEIKSLMGTSLSNEATNIFARDEKILASMQNDKLVNTLMAASAVLAKQRVGSVNYGEAVATAGMAAQEAQGRIVKTEREMNKTRLELAAAQDERDFKAITTAMTRLNHLDTTNTQLQVAVYNANRAATAQDRSDTRHILANEAAAEKARLGQEGSDRRTEVSSLTSQLNGLLRREAIFGNSADQTTPEEKDSVRNEIKVIRTRLNKLSTSRGSAAPTPPPPPPGQTVQ